MSIIEEFIQVKETPLLNYMQGVMNSPNYSYIFNDYLQIQQKYRIMKLCQRSPEAFMVVRAVASDICSNFHFEPLKGTGRNKVIAAQNFSRKAGHRKLRRNTVIDMLLTGEGYQHLNAITLQQAKELVNTLRMELKSAGFEAKAAEYDEDMIRPRSWKWIASTTMITQFDQYDVIGYMQRVGARQVQFNTNEIVKYSFEEIDGKITGFTPFMTMPIHLELLWLIWLNQYYLQAKGNHPDTVFTVEGIDMNHPSYQKLRQEIETYNKPGSPTHGNLLLAGGKYNVHQLEKNDGLQFAEVDRYITTLIAGHWQFPLSRIGIKTAEASNSKDSAGGADKGYWNFIEQYQDYVAEVENSQIWEPFFGVKLVPNKSYKHDEVVEETSYQLQLNNLEQTQRLLAGIGKQLKEEVVLDLLNSRDREINEEDLDELSVDPAMLQTGMLRQNMPNQKMGQGMANSDRQAKRADEISRERNQGKPSGV
jgi:hypothetical protein